jgi:Phosphodiester glycosidase
MAVQMTGGLLGGGLLSGLMAIGSWGVGFDPPVQAAPAPIVTPAAKPAAKPTPAASKPTASKPMVDKPMVDKPIADKPMVKPLKLVPLKTAQLAGRSVLAEGNQIVVNGRKMAGAWVQWTGDGTSDGSIGLSDTLLDLLPEVTLLSTEDPTQQPLSLSGLPGASKAQALRLPAQRIGRRRYIEVSTLATAANWQFQLDGSTLKISLPQTQSVGGLLSSITTQPLLGLGAPADRQIRWAPGILWQRQTIGLGSAQFPITLLRLDPKTPGLSLKPITANPTQMVAVAPMLRTQELWQSVASINGGFFNRKNRHPLGAIKQSGQWLSGPILGRGAIGWTDKGELGFDRLVLRETLRADGKALPLLALNSGYIQAGLSRYSPTWGPAYTTLSDRELILTVEGDRVTQQIQSGAAGTSSYPIPPQGYLIVARSAVSMAPKIGTALKLESSDELSRFPHVLGAGPLLIKDRQIVLDAAREQFSPAFIKESAVRSVIANFADGTIAIIAIQERVGGRGPTLAETAQILTQLGATNALNFDGGSSTSLVLGDQLLNRSLKGVAQVHNGLGVFLAP